MVENEELTRIFKNIHSFFDEMDIIREKILPLQRQIVRNCSEIIKKIHRKEFEHISQEIQQTSQALIQMKSIMINSPSDFVTDYLQIVQQEFGEAVIFYKIITENRIPPPDEVGIGLLEYPYALSDVIGELRRYIMNSLKIEEISEAERCFKWMDEIHGNLFSLDYPKGLIPGLRNKIDQARGIVVKTEGELALSLDIIRLNHTLQKYFNELKK